MLLLLLNLALLWGLLVLYFTVRSDQLGALMNYVADLEGELTSLHQKAENFARHGRYSEVDLAEWKRQKRALKLKLDLLMITLYFIHAPFAIARFLMATFKKK